MTVQEKYPGWNVLLFWFQDDWGKYGRTYEKVAENLARLPEVRRVVCTFPPDAAEERHFHWPLRTRHVHGKLSVVTPRAHVVPTDGLGFRLRRKINATSGPRAFLRWLRRAGFRRENTVLWLFPPHPHLETLIDAVPHRLVVTHIVDDYTQFDPQLLAYRRAVDQYPRVPDFSDLIITSSAANYDKFGGGGAHCVLHPNAVDEIFLGSPSPLPWKNGGRPRLGYVGWITERTDLSLMAEVAKARPDWDLVIAGPQHGDRLERTGLPDMKNVTYLGPLPYEQVPDFLQSLDVCLMPHCDTAYSRSMSPLKLYQYLASGRPIVSTHVAGVERFQGLVWVTRGSQEFIDAVAHALTEDNEDAAARRVAAAMEETWSARIRQMFSSVTEILEQEKQPWSDNLERAAQVGAKT